MPAGIEADRSHAFIVTLINRIIEEAPIPLAVIDGDFRYLAMSVEWQRWFQLDAQEILGHSIDTNLSSGSPAWIVAAKGASQGNVAFGVDRIALVADGPERWVFWKVWPVDADMKITAISLSESPDTGTGHTSDYGYRNERLQEIASTLGVGVLEHDFSTGVTALSDSYLELLGIGRDQIPETDAEWMQLFGIRSPEAFQAERARALDPAGSGICDFKVWPRVNGVERSMRFRSKVVFTGEGPDRRPHHMIGLLIDRTEEHQMEEALARAERLETVGRLAGMVAHDFNNILSVTLGSLELALPKVAHKSARSLIRHAMEATQMGAGFSKRLLTLAGGHAGMVARFQLDAHLCQTWEIYRRVLRDDIDLMFEPGSEAAHVLADPAAIDAAILNLVVNARDAQTDGGRIVISTRRIVKPGTPEAAKGTVHVRDHVEITVSDDGPGMPEHVAARAGEPFFTTKPNGMGSGLGIASVIATMQEAGGTFHIEAGRGGTKATMVLPIVAGETAARAVLDDELPLGDGEFVLVVEDDPMVREMVMQQLEALGYVVSEAPDAQTALAMVKGGEPVDLAFCDVVLPGGLSGLDIMNVLKREHPQIAVLLTSGHASAVYRKGHEPLIGDDIILKPYTLHELAVAVRRSLASKRSLPATGV